MSKSRIILPIEGMTCASCAATVQEALAGATGVTSAGVNFATNKAAIEYDAAQTNVGQLIKTVRDVGYNCGKATVSFGIVDLHYVPSVAPLERSLSRVNGVIRAVANQATETATVDYIPGVVSAEDLEKAVVAAGLQVAAPIAAEDPLERERIARRREIRTLSWKFVAAAGATIVAMIGSMLLMADRPMGDNGTMKQVDLLGRLLMPLAIRLRDWIAGQGWVLDLDWVTWDSPSSRCPSSPGRPAILQRHLERAAAPHRGHEHAHWCRNWSGLPLLAGGNRGAHALSAGRAAGRRLLRGGGRDHRAGAAGPAPRSAC